jgi:hypothetical protein
MEVLTSTPHIPSSWRPKSTSWTRLVSWETLLWSTKLRALKCNADKYVLPAMQLKHFEISCIIYVKV